MANGRLLVRPVTLAICAAVIAILFAAFGGTGAPDTAGAQGGATLSATALTPLGQDPIAQGEALTRAHGCLVCHTTNGSPLIGPTFRGLYGSTVTLIGGQEVAADAAYLRGAIVSAHRESVEGFPLIMPEYAATFTNEQLDAIVAYLGSLGGTAVPPVQATLAAEGQQLVETYSCLNCHTTDGIPYLGPTFLGLYGSTVTLADGFRVVADEVFLRRSILAAHAQAAQGFDPGMMPKHSGIIGSHQMDAILAYLQTLVVGAVAEVGTPVPTTSPTGAVVVTGTPEPSVAPESGPSVDRGGALADAAGCLACHSVDGSRSIGPTFLGLYGSQQALAEGAIVTADAAYLTESILEPSARVAQGYADNVMPSFGARLSSDEVADLVAYIESLAVAAGTPSAQGAAVPTLSPAQRQALVQIPVPTDAATIAVGHELVTWLDCLTCHTTTGRAAIAPTFRGLYGSTVTLSDGTVAVVDDPYIRAQVLNAHAQTVENYPTWTMPDYSRAINAREMDAIIAYIRSLQ